MGTDLLDAPATLRHIAGAPDIPAGEGQVAARRNRRRVPGAPVVTVSENWGFAVFETDRYKLVVDEDALSPCQLFDRREDPAEDHDLLLDPLLAPVADEIMETYVRPFFEKPPARPHPSLFTGGYDT